MYLDHSGWNLIFYTGKAPLTSSIEECNASVRVVKGRPQLSSLIPNIIFGVESKYSSISRESFCLWEENEVQSAYVKGLDCHVMSSWGMMYCGGSGEVVSTLREISIDYDIELHIDSFAW